MKQMPHIYSIFTFMYMPAKVLFLILVHKYFRNKLGEGQYLVISFLQIVSLIYKHWGGNLKTLARTWINHPIHF